MGHSPLGPSSASRWLYCPGSVAANAGKDKTSSYAEEGTTAHALAEKLLRYTNADAFKTDTYPLEMLDAVQDYADYVVSLGGNQEYEVVVDYSDYVPKGYGTADAIVTTEDTLYVIDLKYGKGVRVDAEENEQAMLYALGALLLREAFQKFKDVVIVIYQPRLDHISEWVTTPKRLYEFGEFAKQRATLALAPNAPRVPGEKQCLWCAEKGTCSALYDYMLETIGGEFENLDSPDNMEQDQLRKILDNKKSLLAWLDAVEQVVFERLNDGQEFEGYKLVEGRSNRQWINEKVAEKKLIDLIGNEAYIQKLLSPTQAEKKLGKKKKDEIANIITKPVGSPTLAPWNDSRQPIGVTAEDFDCLETKTKTTKATKGKKTK